MFSLKDIIRFCYYATRGKPLVKVIKYIVKHKSPKFLITKEEVLIILLIILIMLLNESVCSTMVFH